MMLSGEFFIVETERGDSSSFIICPDAANANGNYAEQDRTYRNVRMLRCEITEIVRESS